MVPPSWASRILPSPCFGRRLPRLQPAMMLTSWLSVGALQCLAPTLSFTAISVMSFVMFTTFANFASRPVLVLHIPPKRSSPPRGLRRLHISLVVELSVPPSLLQERARLGLSDVLVKAVLQRAQLFLGIETRVRMRATLRKLVQASNIPPAS
jgi:hypothetical protein